MKKFLSVLVTTALVMSLTSNVFGAQKPAKAAVKAGHKAQAIAVQKGTGVVKAFSDSSVTLGVAGKNSTFKLDKSTKITLGGEVATLDQAGNKGVKAAFVTAKGKLISIDFSNIGDQGQGTIGTTSTYVRTVDTDSSLPAAANTATSTGVKTENGKVTDTLFAYGEDGNDVVALGTFDVIPGSLKVVLNGTELKVIDATAKFDPSVVGDEVQLYNDPDDQNMAKLKFEKPLLTSDTATNDDAQKILSVTYDKKMYKITTTDVLPVNVDESVYSELNGKEVSLATALNRGTFAYYILSPNATIIYVNAFYKSLACTVDNVKGNLVTFSVKIKGKTPFTDTLKVTDITNIHDVKGAPIKLSDIKAKDSITISVDPDNGYSVIDITKN